MLLNKNWRILMDYCFSKFDMNVNEVQPEIPKCDGKIKWQ